MLFDDEDFLDFDVSETFWDSRKPEINWFTWSTAYRGSLVEYFGYSNLLGVHELYEQARGRLTWDKVLPYLNIEAKKSIKTGIFTRRCLFHCERTPSLNFMPAPREARYCCYGCGLCGDILGFVTNYFRFATVSEASEFISRFAYYSESDLQMSLPF